MQLDLLAVNKYFFLYILPILLLICSPVISQEIIRKSYYFEKTLNYKTFPAGSNGSNIIASLSSNNVTNLYHVNIDVNADLFIQLHKAQFGQLSANINLINFHLNGETHFRDFVLDTLLMPDVIEGNLNVYYRNEIIVSQPWLLGVRAGHVRMFIPDTIRFNPKKIRIELELKGFNYSDERYALYQEKTNLINTYYAFTAVLSNMLDYYKRNGLNNDQNPSYLFLAWEEIQRVNNYVYNYHFYNKLNLGVYDPADFITYYDKSIRLQRRATTLKSWVNRSKIKGVLEDKDEFSKGFAGLSEKYLAMARDHQPYIAAGFAEVARVITSEHVKDMLQEAGNLYDVFQKVDSVSTVQTIYNHFVSMAGQKLSEQRYVATLDLLYNADILQGWFSTINKSTRYDPIYVNTIDGLMTSYLKVATMAYKSETFSMAEMYYQKAVDVYEVHKNNLNGEKLASEAFLDFIEQQTELSYKMIKDEEYFKAIIVLNKANEIIEQQNLIRNKSKIDSAYRLSYLGIYDKKLDSIQHLLDEHRPDEALLVMNETNALSEQQNKYLQDVNKLHFRILASALFETYYKQGEMLMNGENADQALVVFLKAKTINDKYLQQPIDELDSLIYHATVPVIIGIVEEAKFDVWANRMQSAEDLLIEATNMQIKYQLTDHEEVVSAIEDLNLKIKNRHCTNLSNECFALEIQARNRINTDKYLEAEKILKDGQKIISENQDCGINAYVINDLALKYKDAFTYYNAEKDMKQQLINKNYDSAVVTILHLEKLYKDLNLSRFEIEMLNPYNYIKSQSTTGLLYSSAAYYIEGEQYEEAFKYLSLIEQQGIAPKDTRSIQQSIGKGLLKHSYEPNEQDQKLAQAIKGTDRWYRYLKKSYQGKSGKILNIFTNK